MPLQATCNPEHLSMSRDSNCTKRIGLAYGLLLRGQSQRWRGVNPLRSTPPKGDLLQIGTLAGHPPATCQIGPGAVELIHFSRDLLISALLPRSAVLTSLL